MLLEMLFGMICSVFRKSRIAISQDYSIFVQEGADFCSIYMVALFLARWGLGSINKVGVLQMAPSGAKEPGIDCRNHSLPSE